MSQFDRLPPQLRQWLAQAALPFSARSALKLWQRSLRESSGNTDAARAALSRAEARLIARDAVRIWGVDHPVAATLQRRAAPHGCEDSSAVAYRRRSDAAPSPT